MSDTMRAAYLADLTYRLAVDELEAQEPWEIWQRAWQAAQSQPAPPVPSSVQEIMRLMMAYVRACVDFENAKNLLGPGAMALASGIVTEVFKPLEAALISLVDDNHRLKFELDGVRAMRGTSLLQHALKLAAHLPDSEIAYTLRLYINGLTESPDCRSDEQIIRTCVQAMPHTNPGIADDLLQGHTMHTEMADILAIWKVASLRSIDTLTIYLDEDAIDVGQFYRAKGFEKLPPTPTMSGAEIRACGWKKNNYQMYIIPPDGALSVPVGDAQAIPLINGMHFWCIPPATAGVSLNEPESPPTHGIEPEQGESHE